MKESIKQAGYTYIRYSKLLGAHILKDDSSGNLELWGANKNHASYGLIYKNTHLEFISEYIPFYGVPEKRAKDVLDMNEGA